MANTINTIVRNAIKTAELFGSHIDDLRAALPASALESRAACMAALQAPVAKYYDITLEVKGTGRIVWPADHANTEAAKKAQQRLATSVLGGGAGKATEEIEIPAELLAAARKLAKLANGYEGSRKLAAKALAAAFAK